jgi:hypothetical protein
MPYFEREGKMMEANMKASCLAALSNANAKAI